MYNKKSNKKSYNKSVVNTNKKRENTNKTNKKSNNQKNKKKYNKMDLSKYTDIKNIKTKPFSIKFNLFGKIVYDKKLILKTFRLFNDTDKNKTIANMYYDDKLIEGVKTILNKYLFKEIDKIKKKDLKYFHNNFTIKVPVWLTFNNKNNTVHKLINVPIHFSIDKYSFDSKINMTSSISFNIMDIFKLIKYISFNDHLINYTDKRINKTKTKEYFDYLMNHKLSGFVLETYDNDKIVRSQGYFCNYKEANREIINKIIDISTTNDDKFINKNANKVDLYYSLDYNLDGAINNLFKYMTVKNFN